jgi:hypothetical protein
MLENTTSDNGFQGNPESGIDRFLNDSATIDGEIILTGDELREINYRLRAEVKELETKLASAEARSQMNFDFWTRDEAKLNQARDLIQEVLDEHTDSTELMETFEDAFKLLGVTMTETNEYTVTATWTISVTHPRGEAPSGYDFTAELELDGSDCEIDGRIPTPEMDVELSY